MGGREREPKPKATYLDFLKSKLIITILNPS